MKNAATTTDNIAGEIVGCLQRNGESKDYIIGFLMATINAMRWLDSTNPESIINYLNRTLEQTRK